MAKPRVDTEAQVQAEGWIAAQREWQNSDNWRGGWLGLYVAPNDPRILVRKREPRFGWTLNFAHRASWIILASGLLVFVALVTLSVWVGAP
jgi:uncharacterized membrane protein